MLKEEAKMISDGFERDQRRSEMVFDRKTLVLAKRARAAKKRVFLARKYKAAMQRWTQADEAAATAALAGKH